MKGKEMIGIGKNMKGRERKQKGKEREEEKGKEMNAFATLQNRHLVLIFLIRV